MSENQNRSRIVDYAKTNSLFLKIILVVAILACVDCYCAKKYCEKLLRYKNAKSRFWGGGGLTTDYGRPRTKIKKMLRYNCRKFPGDSKKPWLEGNGIVGKNDKKTKHTYTSFGLRPQS